MTSAPATEATRAPGACGACLRQCAPGRSFCGRRDARGRLRDAGSWAAVRTDRLFDKPILHFGKDRPLLNLGSWGCNLRCLGCQNARLSWAADGDGLDGQELSPAQVASLARTCGCGGVAYTYNEPAVLLDAVLDVAAAVRAAGLVNVFVTNSTLSPAASLRAAALMDAVAADIKSMDDSFYDAFCGTQGVDRVAAGVLDCVRTFHEAGCHVEVRTNLIPGANDGEANLRSIARWIRDSLGPGTAWHLTRFFPAHRLAHVAATPTATLVRAQRLGLEAGLRHVHVYFSKGCDCARDEEGGCCVPGLPRPPR